MATIASLTTQVMTSSGSTILAKPSGLAVGDYLVAILTVQNAISASPSGFSTRSTSGGALSVIVQTKVADSGDVAASNFTWTNSGDWGGGVLYRITSFNTGNPVFEIHTAISSGANQTSFAIGVTPPVANSILILGGGTYVTSTNTTTFGGYGVVTDNPSWTESLDSYVNDSGSTGGGFGAYATRTQTTATGNASFIPSGGGFSDSSMVLLVIYPQINLTTTESVTVTDTLTKSYSRSFSDTVLMSDTVTKTKTRTWVKQSKDTNSWTTQSKD